MKKHFYAEYNSYGMISYSSFNGPGKKWVHVFTIYIISRAK